MGHTRWVRTLLTSCLAAIALLVSACSASTVVVGDDRAEPAPVERATDQQGGGDSSAESEPPTDEPDEPDDTDQAAETETAEGEAAEVEASEPDDAGDDDRADEDRVESAAPSEGFGLGGAAQLESLLVDCESGSDLACDILFQLSDFDSEEEVAATTCGGRSDITVVFCTPDVNAEGQTSVFDITSDGLDAVVIACTDGSDMTACDFLYFRSPIGSELEAIGATCGDRVEVAVPDCRTALDDQ